MQVLTCKSISCALRASLDSYEHVSSVSWVRRDPFELVHALTWSCALYLCAADTRLCVCVCVSVCVLVASVRVFMGALGGGDPPPLLLSA